MDSLNKSLIVTLVLFLPSVAFSQVDDATYCQTLSDTYLAALGDSADTAGAIPAAISMCATTPAAAIPILQLALSDNNVTVPSQN